jgi:ribosomal-protein-alanine N-acetyltransferase
MSEIREGKQTDLPQLREIQTGALAEPWPELLETAAQGQPPLYVITDGRPVGYVIVVAEAEGVAYVPELAIHPENQGQGYGSELLAWLRQHLADDGYRELRLTVQASDERAQRFYDGHGFERLERLTDHFEDGDGLLLGLELDEESA